jgi:hypothetical protein
MDKTFVKSFLPKFFSWMHLIGSVDDIIVFLLDAFCDP